MHDQLRKVNDLWKELQRKLCTVNPLIPVWIRTSVGYTLGFDREEILIDSGDCVQNILEASLKIRIEQATYAVTLFRAVEAEYKRMPDKIACAISRLQEGISCQ